MAGASHTASCASWYDTSNPIETAFATVLHRTMATKGPGDLTMAFKLIESNLRKTAGGAATRPPPRPRPRAGATCINIRRRGGADLRPASPCTMETPALTQALAGLPGGAGGRGAPPTPTPHTTPHVA